MVGVTLSQLFTLSNHRRIHDENGGGLGQRCGGARLYGKSRKWVYEQIDRYQIRTEKEENWTRLRLVDLIAHRGVPSNGAPQISETHTEQGQIITPENRGEITPEKLGSVDT